jgi:hypothetical protein
MGVSMTFDEAMGRLRGLGREQVRTLVHAELPAPQAARFDAMTRPSVSSEVIRIVAAQALSRYRRAPG